MRRPVRSPDHGSKIFVGVEREQRCRLLGMRHFLWVLRVNFNVRRTTQKSGEKYLWVQRPVHSRFEQRDDDNHECDCKYLGP